MNRNKTYRVRFLLMLALVAIVAVGYFTAGGIGNFCAIGFDTITLICPLGALLAMVAEKTAIPLAVLSIAVVLAVCVVFGKIFCAWACPVHFMANPRKGRMMLKRRRGATDERRRSSSHATEGIVRDVSEGDAARCEEESFSGSVCSGSCSTCAAGCGKSRGVKIDSRHAVLAAAVISTLLVGFPVFCLVCPIGLTFAAVLIVMRLFVFGATTWAAVVVPLLIVAEVVFLPKWCQNFCPLGALLSLFSGLNKTFRPQVDASKCIKESRGIACSQCEHACPEGINLHDVAAGRTTLADCSKCRACADACPEGAISFPLMTRKADKVSVGEERDGAPDAE